MRRSAALATVLNGLGALAPQVIAILSLDSSLFGQFSVAYLAYALATSMVLSLLCDAWVVVDPIRREGGWRVYVRVLASMCLLFGALGGVVTGLFLGPALGSLAALCVLVSTYRVGLRYLLVHSRNWRLAIVSDLLALVVTCLVFFIGSVVGANPLWVVMIAWGCGALAGSLINGVPRVSFSVAFSWVGQNRRTIAPLVADSLIMDIASIGTPYVLLSQLGISGFGLYRAVSNLGAPLRLLLTPLRPLILGLPSRALSLRLTVLISGVALGSGAAISVVLLSLMNSGLVLGVLSELGPFWVPAGVYGCATLLLSFYSLVCRALKMPRILLFGRVVHTALGFVGPIIGFALDGVQGAIWAFSSASFLSACVWMFLAFWGNSGLVQNRLNQG